MLAKLISRLRGPLRAGRADPHSRRALAALDAGALEEALQAFEAALRQQPRSADILTNIASVHLTAGRPQAAAEVLKRALQVAPGHAAAHCNYGMLLAQSGAPDGAAAHLRQVPRNHPAIRAADINLTNALIHGCDWDALDAHVAARIAARADDPDWWRSIEPFQAALLGQAPEVARAVADLHAAQMLAAAAAHAGAVAAAVAAAASGACLRAAARGARLRVAYLSADFHRHATMNLLLETLEAHDRGRIETVFYSYGPDDGSTERRRAVAAADRFVDITSCSHAEAALAIARDGTDILVDLKGHTGAGRPSIVALRPAPLIVNYLGYPGTMGGTLADWYFGDAISTPPGQDAEFSERILRLPLTYQPNGVWRRLPPPPARAALGLPETAIVFCCFNGVFKVGRAAFAAWMAILAAVPDSVLWLMGGNADAIARLQAAARKAGVDSRRLVFADPVPTATHLARMQAAEMFLDTWPFCAHTLASDALRAGLPIVTLPGAGFASRVAASVQAAAGLADLACTTVEEYVSKAVELARDPLRLHSLRVRLESGRARLFDPRARARELEDAYADIASPRGWQPVAPSPSGC